MAASRTDGRTIADLGEFGLIDRIHRALRRPVDGVVLGIGDDTAVLDTGGPQLLLATVDMQVEGRHFIRARTTAEQIGRRVAAVNLSDIGAMGGEPRWALVSLALPKRLPVRWVDGFYRGLDAMLGEFGAVVVGGNLSGGTRITADLTLLGEVERGRLLTRGGARPGDAICVTGTLGLSAAGRAALDAGLTGAEVEVAVAVHLTPAPRVHEGRALAAAGGVTAMMDLSDGLTSDLGHICDASEVGAVVDTDALPVAEETRRLAKTLGLDPVALAIAGGEDFELVFTASPEDVPRLRDVVVAATGTDVATIGRIVGASDGRTLVGGGRERVLAAVGWDHFRT